MSNDNVEREVDEKAQETATKALFNKVSPDYDSGPGYFAYFGRRLVELADIRVGACVLDIASGRGAVLFPAAARVGTGGEVVGIDLADAMARATSGEAARRGLNARVSVMDAEELTFPDESFDYVTCGFGMMFFLTRIAASRKCGVCSNLVVVLPSRPGASSQPQHYYIRF